MAITERYFAANYFDENLSGAQADQLVLKDLVKEKLPHLHRHFCHHDVDISSVTLNWFLTLFINAVPFMVRTPCLLPLSLHGMYPLSSTFVPSWYVPLVFYLCPFMVYTHPFMVCTQCSTFVHSWCIPFHGTYTRVDLYPFIVCTQHLFMVLEFVVLFFRLSQHL